MAGFAVVMTFLTFGFFGLIAAGLLSFVAVQLVKRKFPQRDTNHSAMRKKFALAPFVALLWVVVAFCLHVFISNHLAHQDCGLGLSPDPFVRLPNGYTLGSHNTYDGYLAAPGFQTDVPVAGPSYVRSLVTLRWVGDEFRGSQFDFKTSKVRNFVFNTKTHLFTTPDDSGMAGRECDSRNPACVDAWGKANDEAQTGSASYWILYNQYRHRWPTYLFLLLLIAGESTITLYLVKLWRTESQP